MRKVNEVIKKKATGLHLEKYLYICKWIHFPSNYLRYYELYGENRRQ
jgi:hypothetical protein